MKKKKKKLMKKKIKIINIMHLLMLVHLNKNHQTLNLKTNLQNWYINFTQDKIEMEKAMESNSLFI